MSIFDGIEDKKPVGDSAYFRPGLYLVRIDRVKQDKNRKNEPFVAIETTVIRCIEEVPGFQPHVPGESVCDLKKVANDYFLPEFKGFVAAAFGVPHTEITSKVCESVTDPQQQLVAGILMEVHCQNRIKKDATPAMIAEGKANFTVIRWKHRVWVSDLVADMNEADVKRFFGDDLPEILAREEAEQAELAQAA